jgi:hypothetical protein
MSSPAEYGLNGIRMADDGPLVDHPPPHRNEIPGCHDFLIQIQNDAD